MLLWLPLHSPSQDIFAIRRPTRLKPQGRTEPPDDTSAGNLANGGGRDRRPGRHDVQDGARRGGDVDCVRGTRARCVVSDWTGLGWDGTGLGLGWNGNGNASHRLVHVAGCRQVYLALYVCFVCVSYCIACRSVGS